MTEKVWVQEIANGVPSPLRTPFVVLIDGDDSDWRDRLVLTSLVTALLARGCRYFVCSGFQSEDVHDQIDEVIIDSGYEGIVTTFHGEESRTEVAEFLPQCAAEGMNDVLVLVRDIGDWSGRIEVARHGAVYDPPQPLSGIACSDGVLEGRSPVGGVRYRYRGEMSGWFLSTDLYDETSQTVKMHHVYHVTSARPELAKYLALPPGYRFDDGAEGRIWFDQEIEAEEPW